MKKHSTKVLMTLLFTCLLGFTTIWATTLFKPIRASINRAYSYTLDGKEILKNQPAILYRDKYYVPLENLATTLGYNIAIQEDQANLTSPGYAPKDNITLDQAIITAIDFASNRITIYPKDKPNNSSNQVVLNITPDTVITDKQGNTYDITALNTSMPIQATYSAAMTKSIPPQANAIKIVILNNASSIQPR